MKNKAMHAIQPRSVIFFCFGLAALLVFLAVPTYSSAIAGEKTADGQWVQYKNKDGIIGYERQVQRSKYLETRAETIIDAPIEVLLEVLKDIPAYTQWMHKCKEAIPLKQEGELKRMLYFAQGVPLGSPDRDAVIKAVTVEDYDKATSVTTLQSIDHYAGQLPKMENGKKRQRMIEFSGKWELQMIDPGRTKVVYTAYTNPGGYAPKFIVNGVIRKVSFRSLKRMIPMAKKQKYIDAATNGHYKKNMEAAMKKGK
jgi:hypothetical protein